MDTGAQPLCQFVILVVGLIGFVPVYKAGELTSIRLLFVNTVPDRTIDGMRVATDDDDVNTFLPLHHPYLLRKSGAGKLDPAPSPAPSPFKWCDPKDSHVEPRWDSVEIVKLPLQEMELVIEATDLEPKYVKPSGAAALRTLASMSWAGRDDDAGEVDRDCLTFRGYGKCYRGAGPFNGPYAARISAASSLTFGALSTDVTACERGTCSPDRYHLVYSGRVNDRPDQVRLQGRVAEEVLVRFQASVVTFSAIPFGKEFPEWNLEFKCEASTDRYRVDLVNYPKRVLDDPCAAKPMHTPVDTHFVWYYDLQDDGQAARPVPRTKEGFGKNHSRDEYSMATRANPRCPLAVFDAVEQ